MGEQLSLFKKCRELSVTGETLRDAALKQVSDNNESWMPLARQAARDLPNARYTGEDIRRHVSEVVGLPAHHNAWGALISSLAKDRIIVRTGEHRAMVDPKSHARQTPVYVLHKIDD